MLRNERQSIYYKQLRNRKEMSCTEVLEKTNVFFNKFWDISGGKLFNN